MEFNFKLNVQLSLDPSLMKIVEKVLKEGITVAESPEMQAFRASVSDSLANIAADIQKILSQSGMSQEDKDALNDIAAKVKAAADIVPD